MDLFNFMEYIQIAIEDLAYANCHLGVSDKVVHEDCLSTGAYNGKC
jgi:hypothetical protein